MPEEALGVWKVRPLEFEISTKTFIAGITIHGANDKTRARVPASRAMVMVPHHTMGDPFS